MFKKIFVWTCVLIFSLVLLLTISIVIAGRVFQKSISVILIPKNIPSGFIRNPNVEFGYNKGNKFYYLIYNSPDRGSFNYWIDFGISDKLECKSTTNYIYESSFLPPKTSEGCIVSGTTDKGEKEKIFTWRTNDIRYAIFVKNGSLTDDEVKEMARIFRLELRVDDKSKIEIIK